MALNALPLFHNVAGKRVVVIGSGNMGEAKRRLVERAGGIPCGEPEAHHAKLAFITLADPREAEAAAIRLRGKGVLVNVADRPELCDFITPSILDRDPVMVAISTGGASAGLAKQLRLRLERMLPQSLGILASRLSEMRDGIRARYPSATDRRRALDDALGEGGLLDPLSPKAAENIEEWLSAATASVPSGRIEITLTSDDPEDLTLRQARLLGGADLLLHDADVPQTILDRARADALRRPLPYDDPLPDGLTLVLKRA